MFPAITKNLVLLTMVATTFSSSCQPCCATNEKIDRLTLEAMDSEIELFKLNTTYRIESTKQGKWKPWRQSFFSLAQHGTSLGGITTLSASRWRYWRAPARAPKHIFQTGPALLLIGHSVGLGGLVLEAALDARADRKLKLKGLDRKSYLKKVENLKKNIALKIETRAKLASSSVLTDGERQAVLEEGQVLQDNLDGGLAEASRFAVRHNRAVVGRHVSNLLGTAGLATGGYIGALMSTLAARYKKPHYAGTAGLGFALSGAFIIATPLVTRAVQNYSARRTSARIAGELGPMNAGIKEALPAHSKSFRALVAAAPADRAGLRAQERAAIFESSGTLFSEQISMGAKEAKQQKREWLEKVLVNGAIGGTKLAYGVQLMNAGWSFPDPRVPRPPVRIRVASGKTIKTVTIPGTGGINAGQLFSRRVAAAATTFIPGLSIGVLDTLQARIRGEARSRKAIAGGTAPAQVLNRRLDSLSTMQKTVKAQLLTLPDTDISPLHSELP